MSEFDLGSSRTGWAVLRGIVANHRAGMLALGIASFVGAMMEAGFLVLVTATVLSLASRTSVVGPLLGQQVSVPIALLICVVAAVLRLTLNLVTVWVSARLSATVRTDQRVTVSQAFLRAGWPIQQSEPAGRLQELLTSFVGRVNAAVLALTQAITSALSLLAFLAAGFLVDPVASAAVLGALGALGFVLSPIRRRIRREAGSSARTDIDFATTISEFGRLAQEMHTFGVRERFESRLHNVIRATTEQQRRVQVLHGLLSPIYTFLAYLAVVASVALLTVMASADLASIGAILLLMLRSLSYGQQLVGVSGALAANAPSLEEIHRTVYGYRGAAAPVGTTIPTAATPIRLENVTLRYSPERPPALRDVSFELRRGEVLGVIGPSGAGKSSLAQLVLGLRRPTVGTVTIAGIRLEDVDPHWWTNRVALVPQNAELFSGTVTENIQFFRDSLDNRLVHDAAAQANIAEEIMRLPAGFDTHLGERASHLSGGQRQRLSIARALVARPEVVVLDEPTSALDGKSEALIRDTLLRLKGEVTTIIIAHRMSTLELCDRIMVIEQGVITGLDNPHLLRINNRFYREALEVAGML